MEELRGDGATEHEEVGDDRRNAWGRLRALALDLGDDDGAAHPGDGVGGADLNFFAGTHLLARDGEGELAGLEVDRGAARDFGDREDRAFPDGDDGLAAEEHAGEGLVAGGDGVLQEDVVLELELHGVGEGDAARGDVALERGDDAGLGGLGEDGERGCEEGDEQSGQRALDHPTRLLMTAG